MASPTKAAVLTVVLNNDEKQTFTDVGYYAHCDGLDVVDPATGQYIDRFDKEEFHRYTSSTPTTTGGKP